MEAQKTFVTNQSSVSIDKNSRGVTYSVKAYGDTVEEIESQLDILIGIAKKKAEELKE